ncbi:MAG: methyltransferase domain-containing protein [Phycisphaerales bacterium]
MPRDLRTRDRQPELMDDPRLDERSHRAALRGLARLNRIAGIDRSVWKPLQPMLRDRSADHSPSRVLDVAAGSGDLLLNLARRAGAAGIPIELVGCDISPRACHEIEKNASDAGLAITAFRADVLAKPLVDNANKPPYDIVMCHLFLHHLDEEGIITVLRRMKQATARAVLITDLVRSRRGYLLAWLASRLFTRSRVVHTDALLSVRGALTPDELARLAERAGLRDARIRRVWPQRMRLVWTP